MAGPWFSVRSTQGSDWQDYGQVWLSNGGGADGTATLQMKVELLRHNPQIASNETDP